MRQNPNSSNLNSLLGLSLLIPFIFVPYFFLGLKTPVMVPPGGGALNDVNVGPLTFFHGIRSFVYEFWNHGQILWTSLKGQGVPLLAHDIQSAPLNPLSWPSLFFDEGVYWSVWAISKLFLLTLGTLLIGQKIYKFEFWGSVLFSINLVFGNYVMGWINHPWHTAMVFGIWTFYFSYEFFNKIPLRPGVFAGTLLSFYGLINSGFPGGTVIFGISFVILFFPYFLDFYKNPDLSHKTKLQRTFLFFSTGAIALGLSSFTLFSLFEYVGLAGTDYRPQHALGGLDPAVFLDILFRLDHPANLFHGTSTLRLIPSFLFWVGLLATFFGFKKRNLGDLSVGLLLIFFCLKVLNFIPFVNEFVSSLPVIRNTKFWNFSFVMFLFFWSFYLARGFEFLVKNPKDSRKLFLLSVLITYFWLIAGIFRRLEAGGQFVPQRVFVGLFSLVFATLVFRSFHKTSGIYQNKKIMSCLLALFALELVFVNPSSFLSTRSQEYIQNLKNSRFSGQLNEARKRNPEIFLNFRTTDRNNLLVGQGIPSADLGGCPILTERHKRQRTLLFNTDWEGYMPIISPKYDFSWDWVAAGLPTEENFWNKLFNEEKPEFQLEEKTLPRAYLTQNCQFVSSVEEVEARVQSGQPLIKGEVFLEIPNPKQPLFCEELKILNSIPEFLPVNVSDDRGIRIQIEAIRGPGVLVLADQYYPGWEAVDLESQENLEIIPAQISQRAILLKENRNYEIHWIYRPSWLKKAQWAVFLSALGLFAILALLKWTKKLSKEK